MTEYSTQKTILFFQQSKVQPEQHASMSWRIWEHSTLCLIRKNSPFPHMTPFPNSGILQQSLQIWINNK